MAFRYYRILHNLLVGYWFADQTTISEASKEVSEKGFLRAWGHTRWPRRRGANAPGSPVRLQSTPGNHPTYSSTRPDILNSSNLCTLLLNPTVIRSLQAALMVTRCGHFRSSRRRHRPSSRNGKAKISICNSKGSLAGVEAHVFIAFRIVA